MEFWIVFQDFAAEFYGQLPLNQSKSRPRRIRDSISTFPNRIGETVLFRARVQTSRSPGNKMVFFNFRQGTDIVQGLLIVTPEKISKQMVKWATSLADESIVLVEGIATEVEEAIKSATISNVEIHVSKVSRSTLSRVIRRAEICQAASDRGTWLSPTFHSRRCKSPRSRVRLSRSSN